MSGAISAQTRFNFVPYLTPTMPSTNRIIINLQGSNYIQGGPLWRNQAGTESWNMLNTTYDATNGGPSFQGTQNVRYDPALSNWSGSTFTILCCYVKTNTSNTGMIFNMNRNLANFSFACLFTESNVFEFGTSTGLSFNATSPPNAPGLYVIGFTKNTTTGTLWLNGQSNGTQTAGTNVVVGNGSFMIGSNYRDPGNNFLFGTIRQFFVWNTVLSADDIQTASQIMRNAVVYPPFLTRRLGTMGFRNIPFFSPTQISGLQLWLDAYDSSTFTLSGTAVTQWNDKSGLSNNATQSSAGNRPNYNSVNRNVTFTPTSAQFLNLPNSTLPTGNSSYAYFIVCAWAQAVDGLGVIGGGNYNNANQVFALRSFGGSRQILNYWWGNDLTTGTNAYDVNVPLIVECTYTAGGARAILTNGTQLVTDNPGARNQAVGNNTVAKTFGGEYMDGTISEIIVYNGALTVAQRQQVEGYLAWKWGLQSFLPANHPDKNNILAFIGNTTLTNQIPLRIRFTNAPPIPPLQQGTITTFSYTGSAQNYTVPSNSTRLWVHLWGAGGGGGGSTDAGAWNGGAGAYVTGILNVTPGETLRIVVGLGGSVNTTTTATLDRGGGGAAGNPPNACSSGGGRSAIQRVENIDIVVAGGGSGSGWRQGAAATWFGTSGAGTSVNGANGGGGGTQTAGGAAGVVSGYSASTAGSKGQGGTGGGYASGGGGGWYGGGGGGVSPGNGGTGGAGSSYIDLLSFPSGQNGSVPTAPATTSSYYGGGAAAGGQIGGPTTGGNGRIVLIPVIS